MADDHLPEDDLLIADSGEGEVRPDDRVDDERHDEENRLKPRFVSAVHDALEAGDKGAVYDLVEPLHAADIADLIELLEPRERAQLAATISDLMTGDVVAELNDYVREDLMEALPAQAVTQRGGIGGILQRGDLDHETDTSGGRLGHGGRSHGLDDPDLGRGAGDRRGVVGGPPQRGGSVRAAAVFRFLRCRVRSGRALAQLSFA